MQSGERKQRRTNANGPAGGMLLVTAQSMKFKLRMAAPPCTTGYIRSVCVLEHLKHMFPNIHHLGPLEFLDTVQTYKARLTVHQPLVRE